MPVAGTMDSPEKPDAKEPSINSEKPEKCEKSQLVVDEASANKDTSCGKCSCTINKALLPIKAFYFFFIGALGSLAPFIAILMKQYGLSPQQIGVIFGLRPIIGFISGPLWGILADKFQMRRILLLLSLVFWISVFIALAFIPPPKRLDHCPEDLEPVSNNFLIGSRSAKTNKEQNSGLLNETSSLNLTEDQLTSLRENYGWIYEPKSLNKVFMLFMLLILMGEFVQSPTTALSDAATLELLGPQNLDAYGYQRAWGSLGWAIT